MNKKLAKIAIQLTMMVAMKEVSKQAEKMVMNQIDKKEKEKQRKQKIQRRIKESNLKVYKGEKAN